MKPKQEKFEVIPKKETTAAAVVELTDDETDPSISDDSPNNSTVDLDKKSPDKSKFDDIMELVNQTIPKYQPPIHRPKCRNVPLPPGMPPVIAGVPVKFPITPYRSQISVMNSVSQLNSIFESCTHIHLFW